VTMITAPLAADFVTFSVRSPITWSCIAGFWKRTTGRPGIRS